MCTSQNEFGFMSFPFIKTNIMQNMARNKKNDLFHRAVVVKNDNYMTH